ncbi:MAG: ADYC domain-containing protein [Acetobacteraceae bacterium]
MVRRFIAIWLALVLAYAAPGQAGSPTRLRAVEVVGTVLRAELSDGRMIQGRELEGAVIEVVLQGEAGPQRVRFDRIIADPDDPGGEILLYDMTRLDPQGGPAGPLCENAVAGGHWAFPLRGRWDSAGRHVSDQGWTLTCAGDAQGKCVRFGYKPWKTVGGVSLAPYHQACIRMVRADYCGNQGTTRDGMLIDVYDRIVIQPRDTARSDLTFEAAWGPEGAVCVAHTRVPQNMTLERLGMVCPRLRGRLGAAACPENLAISGQMGEALLFNRSQ